jgi:hypothetical protein
MFDDFELSHVWVSFWLVSSGEAEGHTVAGPSQGMIATIKSKQDRGIQFTIRIEKQGNAGE